MSYYHPSEKETRHRNYKSSNNEVAVDLNCYQILYKIVLVIEKHQS